MGGVLGGVGGGWLFAGAAIGGVLGTGSGFCVGQCTAGNVQFVFSGSFLLMLPRFWHWGEDWSVGYNSMKLYNFPDIF